MQDFSKTALLIKLQASSSSQRQTRGHARNRAWKFLAASSCSKPHAWSSPKLNSAWAPVEDVALVLAWWPGVRGGGGDYAHHVPGSEAVRLRLLGLSPTRLASPRYREHLQLQT